MQTVRQLTAEEPEEMIAFVRIAADAYPAMKINTEEECQRMAERLATRSRPGDAIFGLFRDNQLLGGMRLIDYHMNVRGTTIATGGVGMVAVDLLHKKEKVARDLIHFYLNRSRSQGMPMAVLYPFRIDFYKRMGFGLGAKMNQYSFPPSTLLPAGSKEHVRMLGGEDKAALTACYGRVQRKTHGLMVKSDLDMERLLAAPEARTVGVEHDGQLAGYLSFAFDLDPTNNNFIRNNLHVRELVFETPEALGDLAAFVRAQADQIHRVVIETQDASFAHLLGDPRDESNRMLPSVNHQTNVAGLGLMYRVLDIGALFTALAQTDFGGQTLRLQLVVRDDFVPENDGAAVVHFAEGRPRVAEGDAGHDVTVTMGVSELSSVLMGVVSVEQLYMYGQAQVSDTGYLDTLSRLFAVPRPPMCLTHF